MTWQRKDLLGLQELTQEEIGFILETANSLKEISLRPIKKVPTLRGKTVALLFFEPSTRTRTSFELAAKRLSSDTINISRDASSLDKGESILDTAKNIEAMKIDIAVVRHSCAGVPQVLARHLKAAVVNAGDGAHEHPTQGLLDLFTIKERKRKISGLKVSIIGDIAHSRVARSNIWGLTKLGARVLLCGPKTLMPPDVEKLPVEVTYDIKKALEDADVLNILRLQLERQKESLFPSIREYRQLFGINHERLRYAKADVLILHPGPVNRGIEISCDVADSQSSLILEQVTNGLAIRMAVLYLLSKEK
ncbi:MAG: aspartate carbamoyltransferase catalytic subunit [Candidatus Omnitrophica bacterium]|nr:aspartate carbamoyltransferase catalytic subunit [Candidatus Omnitrophota bacterium]